MENILTLLLVIDWLCNDLHYAAEGTDNFYARHLLADRVRDFGSADDDIKECYYLGARGIVPPPDEVIAGYAVKAKSALKGTVLACLNEAYFMLISAIEDVKKDEPLPSGVHAVLDEIGKRALTYKFLVTKEGRL